MRAEIVRVGGEPLGRANHQGRPVGNTGCGTDCQPWLKQRLIEIGHY